MLTASSSEKGFVSTRDEVPAVLKGMVQRWMSNWRVTDAAMSQAFKSWFIWSHKPPWRSNFPTLSKQVTWLAALTTPVLKGALSKAQKDYWSFVSLVPGTQSTLHTEEFWMPCLCHLWAFNGSWLLTCCLVKPLYKVLLSCSDLMHLIHLIFRAKH